MFLVGVIAIVFASGPSGCRQGAEAFTPLHAATRRSSRVSLGLINPAAGHRRRGAVTAPATFVPEEASSSLPLAAPSLEEARATEAVASAASSAVRRLKWAEFLRRPRQAKSGTRKVAEVLAVMVWGVAVVVGAQAWLGLDWRPFAAGGLSAAFAHGISTPLDVVKTRMQTNPELYIVGGRPSFRAAVRRIVRSEGPMFLWQGVGPTVVGYFFEGALKIGVYELVKLLPLGALAPGPLGALLDSSVAARFVVAGAASGLVAAAVLCPVEDARIRMVADPSYGRAYECRGPQRHDVRHVGNQGDADLEASCCEVDLSLVELGPLKTSLKLYQEEGVQGTFSGFPAMLLKQVPYTVTKQCTFDLLCASGLAAATLGFKSHSAVVLGAAAASSVLSALASQPGDVLLTAHYKAAGPHRASLRRVVAAGGGLGALFAGTKARLLHVGLTNTVQLVAYDYARGLLGL